MIRVPGSSCPPVIPARRASFGVAQFLISRCRPPRIPRPEGATQDSPGRSPGDPDRPGAPTLKGWHKAKAAGGRPADDEAHAPPPCGPFRAGVILVTDGPGAAPSLFYTSHKPPLQLGLRRFSFCETSRKINGIME